MLPRRRINVLLALMLVLALVAVARRQRPPAAAPEITWKLTPRELPGDFKVYAGYAPGQVAPGAWYVDIDYTNPRARARPWLCDRKGGRDTTSNMALVARVPVAINGGYFHMQAVPAPTYSLVLQDGKILARNIAIVNRSGRAYPVTRGAFGFIPAQYDAAGKVLAPRRCEAAWIAQFDNAVWAYPRPVPHTAGRPAAKPTRDNPPGGRAWEARDAIGGGPVLIKGGVIQDTYENEVFFGAGFPGDEAYTRAAIGYTKTGHIILFVTDGRQPYENLGLTLDGTAREMARLGCVEAMNLDGGGSESLAINGQCINQDRRQEREVTSMLGFEIEDNEG